MSVSSSSLFSPRGAAATVLLVLLAGAGLVVGEPPSTPEVPYETYDYDGSFTFARIKFEPTAWGFGDYTWGLDLKWNHDYPQAEQNLMKILDGGDGHRAAAWRAAI